MPEEDRIRVRTTNLVSVLIIICAMLYLTAFLFQNLAPALLAFFISLYLVYNRVAFSSKLRECGFSIQRNVLSRINFIGAPITVKVQMTCDIPNMNVVVEDLLPRGLSVASGSNSRSFVSVLGKTHRFSYTVKGDSRGYYRFPGMRMTFSDKRGLFRAVLERGSPDDVLVHTDLNSIKQAKLLAKRHSLELTEKTTARLARSRHGEYEGVREYGQGDRLRDVDWKATSRLTKLMSKIFDAESTIPVTFMLDCSRSMRRSVLRTSKLDYGINAALQMLRVLKSRGHPVGLLTFDEHRVMNHLPPDVKRDQYNIIIDMLKDLPQTLEDRPREKGGRRYPVPAGRKKLDQGERTFLRKVSPFISDRLVDSEDRDRARGVFLGVQRLLRGAPKGSLIILVSDLETDLDTVHSALKLARVRKNRVYVISPYSPWFGLKKNDVSVGVLEDMYEEYIQKQNAENSLRKIGVDVINVGPRTPGAELLAGLRRHTV